ADEDVELAELALHPSEHAGDVVGAAHVGLDDEAVGAALFDLGEGVLRRRFILAVIDRDLDALPGELERNAPADAARASGDQCVFPFVRHDPLQVEPWRLRCTWYGALQPRSRGRVLVRRAGGSAPERGTAAGR